MTRWQANNEFRKSNTYAECVYYAFYDENNKKYSHQYRIPRDTLDKYKEVLLSLESEFKECKKFDKIYKLFKSYKTYGIGSLTIYDVVLRVSQNYGIYPNDVYLHAGTRAGALQAGLIKKYDRRDKLTIKEITDKLGWLKNVEACVIEDFLCVCKNDITEEKLKLFLRNKISRSN